MISIAKNAHKTHGCTSKRTGKRTPPSHINKGDARNARLLPVRTHESNSVINNKSLSCTREHFPCVPCVPSVHAGFTRAFACAFTRAPVRLSIYTSLLIKKEKRESK